jgi:hypothetical protein
VVYLYEIQQIFRDCLAGSAASCSIIWWSRAKKNFLVISAFADFQSLSTEII